MVAICFRKRAGVMRERKSDGPHSTDYETILCCGLVEGFEYTAKGPTIASIPSPPPCSMSALFGRRQAKAAPLAPRLRKGGEKHPPDQETPILPSDGGGREGWNSPWRTNQKKGSVIPFSSLLRFTCSLSLSPLRFAFPFCAARSEEYGETFFP